MESRSRHVPVPIHKGFLVLVRPPAVYVGRSLQHRIQYVDQVENVQVVGNIHAQRKLGTDQAE